MSAPAAGHGAAVERTHDAHAIPRGGDAVHTRRGRERGVERAGAGWRRRLGPFRVTPAAAARVPKPRGTAFLHDLPAVRGEDVDGEVLDGARSLARARARRGRIGALAVMEGGGAGAVDEEP